MVMGFFVATSKNHIELKTGRHWIGGDQCMYSEFFIPDGCPMIDRRMIREHILAIGQFLEDVKVPFLVDLTSSDSILSFDALKEWGQSEVLNNYRVAEAYVVSTLADLIFLKQHIRLNKLAYPARAFQSATRAKEWLVKTGKDYIPPFK